MDGAVQRYKHAVRVRYTPFTVSMDAVSMDAVSANGNKQQQQPTTANNNNSNNKNDINRKAHDRVKHERQNYSMETLPMERNACQHTHNAVNICTHTYNIYCYCRIRYALTRSMLAYSSTNDWWTMETKAWIKRKHIVCVQALNGIRESNARETRWMKKTNKSNALRWGARKHTETDEQKTG